MRTLLLLLLFTFIGSCAADVRATPERIARAYARMKIDGDLEPVYTLLTSWDRAALPEEAFPGNAPPHARLWPNGLPRTELDSVRVLPRADGGAIAVAFMTAPDFAHLLGRDWERTLVSGSMPESELDRITADAPRTVLTDTIMLEREDGSWRIAFAIAQYGRAEKLWPAIDAADRVETRAAAARAFLAVADSVPGYDIERRRRAANYMRAGALSDSLAFALKLEGHAFSTLVTGEVRNRSRTSILALDVNLVTTTGQKVPFSIGVVPAGGIARVMKLHKASGQIRDVEVTDMRF